MGEADASGQTCAPGRACTSGHATGLDRPPAAFDFVCGACGHAFEVTVDVPIDQIKRPCPRCGSDSTRQTFASCLRNGPLLDPLWGYRGERTNYG